MFRFVLRRNLIVVVGLVASAMLVATALAAGTAIRAGVYAPKETWVTHHTSASVDLTVIDHGKMIRAKGSGLSCPNNGKAPLVGSYADIPYTVQLPDNIPITASGHFSFSGAVKVSAYEDQTPSPITTQFSISGRFVKGTVKPLKTIAVRGRVSSDYCTAATPEQYKLVFDPSG